MERLTSVSACQDATPSVTDFVLTQAEKLQVINLAPSTAVEIHLVIECCSERLGDEVRACCKLQVQTH